MGNKNDDKNKGGNNNGGGNKGNNNPQAAVYNTGNTGGNGTVFNYSNSGNNNKNDNKNNKDDKKDKDKGGNNNGGNGGKDKDKDPKNPKPDPYVNPGVDTGGDKDKDKDKDKPKDPNKPDKPNKPVDPITDPVTGDGTQVVPGNPGKNPNAINVVDYAGQLVTDPSKGFRHDDPSTPQNESMLASDHLTKQGDVQNMMDKGSMDPNDPNYQMNANSNGVQNQNVVNVQDKDTATYQAQQTQQDVAQQDMTGAQGQVSSQAVVEAAQADIKGIATGVNADGSVNEVGKALQKYAAQDFTNIIDTSTSAGKLLAQQLGEGNYTDSKATLQGQLEILSGQFVDPNTGEPKIPAWAAGTARNVSKIMAFKGMTGSAATAAMSQALLEASIPIAQADAQFFQTLTLQNLSNKQQATINAANTIAKFEQTNVDNRMAAAIQNAKAFLDMDMKNLDNEQQAKVINNQARVQSILEDAKATNAQRLFTAENQNEMDKFYDELNTQINQYNSGQNLDAQKFSSTMADSREKFYKEMQYNIGVANAKWRQEVQLNEDQQAHEAATTDVKNMVDLSVNQLNQIWDRSDAMLDYAWKSFESEANRRNELAKIALMGEQQMDAQMMESLGLLAGTFVGSGVGQNLLKGLFGG